MRLEWAEGTGNYRKNPDHPDHSIKIDKNTEKSPEDLRNSVSGKIPPVRPGEKNAKWVRRRRRRRRRRKKESNEINFLFYHLLTGTFNKITQEFGNTKNFWISHILGGIFLVLFGRSRHEEKKMQQQWRPIKFYWPFTIRMIGGKFTVINWFLIRFANLKNAENQSYYLVGKTLTPLLIHIFGTCFEPKSIFLWYHNTSLL